MKLPNHQQAFVEESKVVHYLLDEENSGGKAGFFAVFGFTVSEWEILRDALLDHATTHDVAKTMPSPHGIKYIIEGELQTPDGRSPQIRAIWIVDAGQDYPRLVTAYPLDRS